MYTHLLFLFDFLYSHVSIVVRGVVVASLCCNDERPRHDIGPMHETVLEQTAKMMSMLLENWATEKETKELEAERQHLIQQSSQMVKTAPPDSKATLVSTDVQGSTRLWEANPVAMHQALKLHDDIMRKHIASNFGFEITTEGDAFQVAFHDSIDAIRFALAVQEDLYNCPWGDDILALSDACKDLHGGFCGLRVRMAIHSGPVLTRKNAVSGRQEYYGNTMHITKSLEDMAHGGQILVTEHVWNAVSFVAGTTLESTQVIDLGEHVVKRSTESYESTDGLVSVGVVQLVPSKMAYDFSASHVHDGNKPKGRAFPPPITMKQLSPSYHDAPGENNKHVAMMFIYTSEIEKAFDNPGPLLAALAKRAGKLIGRGPGYQCKNFMFAFHNASEAVTFGLGLQKSLQEQPFSSVSLHGMVKVGIHSGNATCKVPHRTTGRADYFGQVVNR